MQETTDPPTEDKQEPTPEQLVEVERQKLHAGLASNLMTRFSTVYHVDALLVCTNIDIVYYRTPAITDSIVIIGGMQVPRVSGRGTWFNSFETAQFYALDQLSCVIEDSQHVLDNPDVAARVNTWKTDYKRLKKMTAGLCRQADMRPMEEPKKKSQVPTGPYKH